MNKRDRNDDLLEEDMESNETKSSKARDTAEVEIEQELARLDGCRDMLLRDGIDPQRYAQETVTSCVLEEESPTTKKQNFTRGTRMDNLFKLNGRK
jgi:hypothetical protein